MVSSLLLFHVYIISSYRFCTPGWDRFLLLFHILLKLNACLGTWQAFAEFQVNKRGIKGLAWIEGKLFELQEGWNFLFCTLSTGVKLHLISIKSSSVP